ncbi:hypothetical protein AAFF_G00344580 [Aldrovandia affinis]|uniref:DUF3715 domain-containing protein n=1 Tax=Aldrovandia affinis TaxID=143900 RepID=A0AAD7SKA9_9TELE|nr:hypothetical protein AAFF_G00344580 [Aldrovandia affinis]
MASNLNMERQQGKGTNRRHGGEVPAESCVILKHLLPAAVASSQDGEQAVCEGLASEQEATERRRSVSELKHNSSPSAYQRPLDELPRLNFQIPRKNKERKALFQNLPQGSREFEDIVKSLSSCYRDASSSGAFSYTKARLVHSELLEKDFVEKRRELKQDGRTDKELAESYGFLLPDPSKLHWICEKGLSVGHARITTLGNPALGVYLSKYSDLLQINPFDSGAKGNIIMFKVMKGKVKSIYENMSKNVLDPTPKFDCHVSKNATRVTSLLSYRAFELTQQYFYEYSFDDIKRRPRHVCPYAVVSFQYKGKEAAAPPKPAAPPRSNCKAFEGTKAKSSYTVWSGQLLNRGRVMYQVGLRSSTRPFLPFKLPEKLEIGMAMNLDQVRRKIPAILFSWDTYLGTREVLKSGLYCSLFEVVDKSKHGNNLTALLHKLERERTVLVNNLPDKGFLFLLSSAQMVNSNERRGGWTRCLQALFVFQESRGITKLSSKGAAPQERLQADSHHPIMAQLDAFLPALHYALMKARSSPSADLAARVERQAQDYLSGRDDGKVRLYYMNEYKQDLDERERLPPTPKQKHNLEGCLRSYIYRPNVYLLAVEQARGMVASMRKPPEYSPVSDWEGSDGQPPEHKGAGSQANGAHGAPQSQADGDPEKMRELLKLIQMWKRSDGDGPEGREGRGLKRKLEEETAATAFKFLKRASLDNGGQGRVEEGETLPSLSAVMNCMGLRDTDLSKHSNNTSRLIEMLATFNKAKKSSSGSVSAPEGPSSPVGPVTGGGAGSRSVAGDGPQLTDVPCYDTMIKLGLPSLCDIELRSRAEEEGQDDLEDQTAGSMSSLEGFSPCSSNDQHRGTEILGEGQMPWVLIPITGMTSAPGSDISAIGTRPLDSGEADRWMFSKSCIRSEKYCLRDEDNPQDPRFLQSPAASNLPTPEKSHNLLPEPLEDRCMPMEGEGVEEQAREEDVSREGLGPPSFPDQGAAVDGIIDDALGHFSIGMQEILLGQRVYYGSESAAMAGMAPAGAHRCRQQPWVPGVAFSEYTSHCTSPVPYHSYVVALCEGMSLLAHPRDTDALALSPSPAHGPAHSPAPSRSSVSAAAPAPVPTPTPVPAPAPALLPTVAFAPALVPLAPAAAPSSSSSSSSSPPQPPHSLPRLGTVKEVAPPHPRAPKGQGPPRRPEGDSKRPPQKEGSGSTTRDRKHCTPLPVGEAAPAPPTSISSLISQLKPEVFSSLVEIIKDVQKNAVKFYIHSQEQESDVCLEIKEYLVRLGNVDCDPQAFLESQNNLDKLLIIIQNQDIAEHVHEIPALVSLKKLPSVSFAGVDSLDDVKNHTYNELFISGGFIVSDEFVLNPEFITHERLEAFLRFLEEQSTPESLWQLKVHCKTHKKLKELGRSNSVALSLLNLLTAYRKRHLVEFLPYHACDARARHTPDLDCLIRLQAHNTKHRHIIFFTERRFEMFPHHSSNGIVIANMDDIMNSFSSLIGFQDDEEEPPASDNHPSPVSAGPAVTKECLDSEVSDTAAIEEPGAQRQEAGGAEGVALGPWPPFLPQNVEFLPPLPEQDVLDVWPSYSSGEAPEPLDCQPLKSAVSQFKASSERPPLDFEVGGSSPGTFNVNPHQSFLCPAARTSAQEGGQHGWAHLGTRGVASQDDGVSLTPAPLLEPHWGKPPTPGSGNSASGTPNSQGGTTPGPVQGGTMPTKPSPAQGGTMPTKPSPTQGGTMPTKPSPTQGGTMPTKPSPTQGGTMPTKPSPTQGGTMPTKPSPAQGGTMPTKPSPAQGGTMPTKPGPTQGGTMPTKPSPAQGGTMPTKPSPAQGGTMPTKPGPTQGGTMPTKPSPAQGGTMPTKPSPAQGGTKPGPTQGGTMPTKPSPTQGGTKPAPAQGGTMPTKPSPAQGGTKPAPAQGGTMPTKPSPAQGGTKPGPAQGGTKPGSLTPGPPKGPTKAAEKTLTRGGSSGGSSARGSGGLLPLPQGGRSVNGWGRGAPPAPFKGPRGNGVGAVPVGYRGLSPSRSRPRGFREGGGGGPCVRGFPPHGSRGGEGRGRGRRRLLH